MEMQHETIRFEEAVKIIDSGKVVELSYVKLDVSRKTGGEICEGFLQITKSKNVRMNEQEKDFSDRSKSSNHSENFTRNFYKCQNGKPTSAMAKVHLHLILFIDNKKVLL